MITTDLPHAFTAAVGKGNAHHQQQCSRQAGLLQKA
jgi:hypothetical protein